ncbi:phage tail protein [Kitasatospora sp. NPDC058965]|uniref:phage tail protein n=1 Tax=Kitasatospora sp. NPDC058965 TaxID=3346682 RepID=UPI003673B180
MTTTRENLPSTVTPVNGVLVGCVIGYGGIVSGNAQAPAGWLFCDGSAVSRTTYAALFGVIGTQHGGGDGTTTFNLPDHRGQFHRGVSDGTGNDPDSATRTAANPGGATGDQVGSVQGPATARPAAQPFGTDSQGDHQHTVDHLPTASSHPYVSASHYAHWNSGSADSDSGGDHSHTTTPGGGDADTCPVNLYLHRLIYCGVTS